MKEKIQILIRQLLNENNDRSIAMNDKDCSQYNHTVLVHTYNSTLDVIKRLENINNQ